MKLCIPAQSNSGMSAPVCDHFGSAPFFTIYDTETGIALIVDNGDREHIHGSCNPVGMLTAKGVSSIVCRGMGIRALAVLKAQGILAYRTDAETVEDAVKAYRENKLKELDPEHACRDHLCG